MNTYGGNRCLTTGGRERPPPQYPNRRRYAKSRFRDARIGSLGVYRIIDLAGGGPVQVRLHHHREQALIDCRVVGAGRGPARLCTRSGAAITRPNSARLKGGPAIATCSHGHPSAGYNAFAELAQPGQRPPRRHEWRRQPGEPTVRRRMSSLRSRTPVEETGDGNWSMVRRPNLSPLVPLLRLSSATQRAGRGGE
jgi:hypothetical protein